ncbi:amidinotransferase [Sulfitobacter mediterraneus]|uniref:citrulline utilization hydrolase CtlX n=1 Tax=Sulfitobacter mediterraneus TaxID=83219 RepID=UPI001931A015|nr:arginine deiminase-related protein [Sulfitobacter mediterraneus]MBM1631905.1 amidinotransferase [Sulfitobacter mediterraneus]MBM1639720.1 amidinotransferase [Sulfitobacter mediterraneus]MBM1643769.1 amidinotransferase [Sulfitobacter mediterraneus]MBM1647815.1 amidinotransferase [Sulfitobacter mediterraneus]MBM1651860.1 amidinotransferase [Sulfitobacter mediterraneus]
MFVQAPKSVVMIRPHHFRSNPETRGDNAYQSDSAGDVAALARGEFDHVVGTLRGQGIAVHDFDDTGTDTPDSVFPNNWFSSHAGGHVAVYPMYAANRRRERRWDVIEMLKSEYRVQDIIDYSGLEYDNLALEGTGAMVLDHIGRVAYVARSKRADPVLLERFCTNFNFEPIAFDAADAKGTAVYHTNVLMAVGTRVALVGLEMITDPHRRAMVKDRLTETGRDVIALSEAQIAAFAGNAIELEGKDGLILALSARAFAALEPDQVARITESARIVPLNIPTIETAGGSVRCMIAGLHLSRRTQ